MPPFNVFIAKPVIIYPNDLGNMVYTEHPFAIKMTKLKSEEISPHY